jgi:Tol biopolymer transport system component
MERGTRSRRVNPGRRSLQRRRWPGYAVFALALASVALIVSMPSSAASQRGSILFWADHGAPGPSLWGMRPDGSNPHLIYHAYANAKRPSLSPDGSWIAFDGASPGRTPMSDFDVQVVRTNGNRRRTVAGTSANNEVDAQWSPNGRRLAFSSWPRSGDWRSSSIWTVRRDGRRLRRIGRGQFARWSPDGKQLVLDAPTSKSDGSLFIIETDGTGRRQLTKTTHLDQPAGWSPDGRWILFTRYRVNGTTEIAVIRIDGSGYRRLAVVRGDEAGAAAWSPDGSKILYTDQPGKYSQCFVMRADGSHRRNISRSHFDDVATSWH